MAKYFVYLNDQIQGPFDAVSITQLPGFTADLKLCPEGTLNWSPAAAVPEFSKLLASVKPVTPPPPPQSDDTRECPFCAELIKAKAVKCRFCGSPLDANPAESRPPAQPQSATPSIQDIRDPSPTPAPSVPSSAASVDVGDKSRRLATVLFADLSGFTAMSREKDPEEVHEIMNALLSDLAGAVDRHGGKVDKYIGDCVMAVWGLDETREEDAFGASTAALSMWQRVRSRAERLGIPLAIHTGINTGEVLFGSIGAGSHVSQTVMGDAVNLACRLCDAAPKGEIYVSESTWHRLDARYESVPKEVNLKGIGKLTAYQLVPTRRSGTHTPHRVVQSFQSRDREAERITTALSALRTGQPNGSGILVTGPGGVGKSRLCAHAINRHGNGLTVLFGRSVPASPPPFAGVVSEWLSDLMDGSQQSDIDRFLSGRPALEPYRRDLQLVLSSDAASEQDAEEGPKIGLDRQLAAFFMQLSKDTPLVFAAADVQWLDPFSLDVIVALAEASVQTKRCMFLLLDGRPGSHADRIAGSPGIEQIRLDYLLSDQMRSFLAGVIEGDLTAPWVETLRRRTGGNVLNLMQILDALAEQNILEKIKGTDKWRLTCPLDEIPVPESLADIIWRRIERLPSREREILMVASICGVSFPRQILTVASGWKEEDIAPSLNKLSEDSLMVVTPHQITFEHGSIHEVARRLLLKNERKKIAEQILDHYKNRIWHADMRPLAEGLHRDAGRMNALREFIAHDANRLIGIYRFEDARKLLSGIDAQGWDKDHESMKAHALYLNAISRLAEYEDDYDSAIEHSRKALEIGQKLDERTVMLISLSRLARISFRRKNIPAAQEYCEESLKLSRELNDSWHIAKELITLGQIAERDERYDEAHRHYEEARSIGNWATACPRKHVVLLNSLGEVARKQGKLEVALNFHKEEYAYACEKNDPRGIAFSLYSLAEVARDNADGQAARLLAEVARDIRDQLGDRRGVDYANRLLESIPADNPSAKIIYPEISEQISPIIERVSARKT